MSSSDNNIEVSMKPFQELYQAKEWLKAMQWLDGSRSHLGEGNYHFNKGVVAIKLDELPLARYHFELADKSGLKDPWIFKNIESIKSELGLQLVEPKSFFETVKVKTLSTISLDNILSCVLIVFLCLLIIWFRKKIQKSFYLLSTFVLLTFILAIFIFSTFDQNLTLTKSNEAIIIEQVSIYEGPSAIFEELGKLPPGLKVSWEQLDHGWAKITAPINFRGWIQFNDKDIKQL